MENKVYVVSAERTAVGKIGGTLRDVEPDDLLRPLFESLKTRNLVPVEKVDEVIIGQAKQTQDHANIARKALLKAKYPITVPGYTVNRACGSGMQAIHNAYLSIKSGLTDIVIAGGVESMSTAPYYLRKARYGYLSGNAEILDPNKESQPGSQPIEDYGRLVMGMTAENLAVQYSISRLEQDQFALESQQKAHRAIEEGTFEDEIVPVVIPRRKGEPVVFTKDEHPRETDLQQLAKLKPAFKEGGSVTAGNSSGLNDGASLLMIASEKAVKEYGLKPMAEIIGLGVGGVSPEIMGIGPVEATRKALALVDLQVEDIDLFELNEAFAAQALSCIKELKMPTEKVNINGGAIALGHPIGNSGARICVTLLHSMKKQNKNLGLATLCIAGGQGIATIFKRVID